jgi:hypothetical protein
MASKAVTAVNKVGLQQALSLKYISVMAVKSGELSNLNHDKYFGFETGQVLVSA